MLTRPYFPRVFPCVGVQVVLVCLAWACLVGAPSAIGAESKSEIEAQIRQLGSDRFLLREEASARLLDYGAQAMPQLTQAIRGSDREVRDRARRIVLMIREQERAENVARFRAGEALPPENTPGWERFQVVCGEGASVRDVYALMLDTESTMLHEIFNSVEAETPVRRVTLRRFQQLSRQPLDEGSIATFLFVGQEFPTQITYHPELLASGSRSRELQEALFLRLDGGHTSVLRELYEGYLNACDGHVPDFQRLSYARIYGFSEASIALATKLLRDATIPVTQKSLAIQAVAHFGDNQHAPMIEPYLQDETSLRQQRGNDQSTLELRDVALACLFELRGYGARRIGFVRSPRPHETFTAQSMRFATPQDRERAFALWTELEAGRDPAGGLQTVPSGKNSAPPESDDLIPAPPGGSD